MNCLMYILSGIATVSMGRIIVKHLIKFNTNDWLENLLLYFGLGTGVMAMVVYFLGLFSFLNKLLFTLIIILLAIYGITHIDFKPIKEIYNSFVGLNKIYKLIWLIFCVCVLANLISSYIPPIQSDVLQYHLLIPKYYLNEGRIFDLSKMVRYSVFPQLMELLFLLGMLLKSDVVAQLIHTGFGVFAALAVFAIGKKYFNYKVAVLGMLIFYVSPIVRHLSGTAMIDLGTTFFFLLSGYVFLKWLETQDKKWLIFYAVFCGFSFGTKYTGVLALMWLPLGIIFRSLINKEFRLKRIIVKLIFPALLYILIISPWLVRNYIYTGNPVSPFFYNIFGGNNWNDYIEGDWKSHLSGGMRTSELKNYLILKLKFLVKIFIHTPLNIVSLFLFFFKYRGKARIVILLFLISILYIITGAFVMPRIYRFFLPALAVISMVSACMFYKIVELHRTRLFRVIKILVFSFMVIGITNRVYETLASAGKNWQVIFGFTTREDFLNRKLGCYGLVNYINSNLRQDDKILSLNETRGYYFNSKFIVSHEVVSGSILHTSGNMNEIVETLKKNNIKYVFISKSRYFQNHQRPTILLKDNNLDKYFKLVATASKCFLYKIKSNA